LTYALKLPFFESAQAIAANVIALSSKLDLPPEKTQELSNAINLIVAEIHHNIGCIGTETNQPRLTLKHFKIFNQMMIEKIVGDAKKQDVRLSVSWNELGNAHMLNKNYQEGEGCFKISLESAKELYDYRAEDHLFPYVNLGLSYWLLNRYEEALEVLNEGLRYRELAYGIDDTKSFMWVNNSEK
jgi:tetratricopeptide (TPR) repeat protein